VAVLSREPGRLFSTNSRPALRAAACGGRPRAGSDGHRGAGRSEPGFGPFRMLTHALAQWTGEPSGVIVIAVDDEQLREHEIFAKSHAQVLEDLKLLDDKLGRIVLSLAFLTAAAVALFSNLVDKPNFKVVPTGSNFRVTAFAFLTFMVAAGLSLLVALAGTLMVGLPKLPLPPLPLPRRGKRQGKSQPVTPSSLLFFKEIARNSVWWEQRKKHLKEDNTDNLTKRLTVDFLADTLDIAKRARYKEFRALESLAFLHLAIVSLVLLAIFVTNVYSIHTWWIASIFLIICSLLPLVDALDLRLAGYPEREGRLNWTYGFVHASVVIAAFLLSRAPYWHIYSYALSYALFGAILAPRVALVSHGHAWVAPLVMVIGLVLLALAWPG
jgi:hypothetical protein